MDAALEMRTETENCARCGGLMVGEFCMDMLNGTGELESLASRCVQCGEVVDPVILMNRRRQRPSSTYSLFGSGEGRLRANHAESTRRLAQVKELLAAAEEADRRARTYGRQVPHGQVQ